MVEFLLKIRNQKLESLLSIKVSFVSWTFYLLLNLPFASKAALFYCKFFFFGFWFWFLGGLGFCSREIRWFLVHFLFNQQHNMGLANPYLFLHLQSQTWRETPDWNRFIFSPSVSSSSFIFYLLWLVDVFPAANFSCAFLYGSSWSNPVSTRQRKMTKTGKRFLGSLIG